MKTANTIIATLMALGATASAGSFTYRESRLSDGAYASVILSDETRSELWSIGIDKATTTSNMNEEAGTPPLTVSGTTLTVTVDRYGYDGSALSMSGTVTLSGSYSLSSTAASLAGVPVTLTGYAYNADGTFGEVTRTVTVTASWAAISRAARTSYSCNDDSTYVFHYRSSSASSDASFTGQVLDAGTDLIAGGSISASIGSSSGSTFSN